MVIKHVLLKCYKAITKKNIHVLYHSDSKWYFLTSNQIKFSHKPSNPYSSMTPYVECWWDHDFDILVQNLIHKVLKTIRRQTLGLTYRYIGPPGIEENSPISAMWWLRLKLTRNIYTLRAGQNGCYFADIFKLFFILYENCCILMNKLTVPYGHWNTHWGWCICIDQQPKHHWFR